MMNIISNIVFVIFNYFYHAIYFPSSLRNIKYKVLLNFLVIREGEREFFFIISKILTSH